MIADDLNIGSHDSVAKSNSNAVTLPSSDARPHPSLGLNAHRGCTDILCILLFIIFWAVMFFVASIAFKQGDFNRVLFGVDYMGNVCGQGSPSLINYDGQPVTNWSLKKYIWYPIALTLNPKLNDNMFNLGICVESCPKAGPARIIPYRNSSDGPGQTRYTPLYFALYDSAPSFNRCLPNITSLMCNTSCAASATALTLLSNSALGTIAQRSVTELYNSYWVILVCCAITIVVSFVWLLVLRRLVKPVVVLTVCVLLAVFILGGVLCYTQRTKSMEEFPNDTETPKYWLAGAIACWVVAFLFFCVAAFLWRDVMTACDIIEEASKVPLKIPTMMLAPPVLFFLFIPLALFTLFVAVAIQTCGDKVDVSINAPQFAQSSSAFNSFVNSTFNMTGKTYTVENWRTIAHLYNLFMFLWSFGVANAVCFMVLAFCGTFWYFSNPGDDKMPPPGAVIISWCKVIRFHYGTVVFGAFLVALIQIMRVILLIIEKKLSAAAQKNDAVKGIFACLHCYLACLERAMKYISKNSYIVTTIDGKNFIDGAREALNLLLSNAGTVGAITIIGEYVMIFGKLLITGLVTIIGYLILRAKGGGEDSTDDTLASGVLIVFCVALTSFFIATLFINIFSVCIDTVLICFCYEKAHPSSAGEAQYFPSDLAAHVAKQAARKGAANPLPSSSKPGDEKELSLIRAHALPDKIDL
jgi:choline transporter-like protein 2/4/5